MIKRAYSHVKSSYSLPLSVFCVSDRVTDDLRLISTGTEEQPNMTHILKEDLEHTTSLLVNETRDTLHTTTTCETTDSRLGNSLNVVTENFPVALRTTLSEAFSTLSGNARLKRAGRSNKEVNTYFSASRHCCRVVVEVWVEL